MAWGRSKDGRAQAAAYNETRAITAAATRVKLSDQRELQRLRNQKVHQAWQTDAWFYFDKIGEIKFGFGLSASVLSRLRLYAAAVVDPEAPPVPVAEAVVIDRPEGESEEDTINQYQQGIDPKLALDARDLMRQALARTSVPGMLRQVGLNMLIPGECYLVEHDDEWHVYSSSELEVNTTDTVQLRVQPGDTPIQLDKDKITVGRVWQMHPRFQRLADSSMHGVIDDCAELALLGQMMRGVERSQLNAGILFIPDEVEVVAQPVTDDTEEEIQEEHTFSEELVYSITEPVRDEKAANSVVPLLLRGPAEAKDAITYIEISRKSDEFLVARADRALERILQGIDLPKDIVTGLANVKYSNAIQIDENLYKAHVEPLALVICDALTEIILRPLLKAKGWSDEQVDQIVVWYDPSEVVTRPDRAADARELYDRKELSGAALRQAHSYGEDSAPSEEELARRLALESPVPPEAVSVLLKWLLPKMLKGGPEEAESGGLPDDLQQTLNDTDTPEQIEVPPTESALDTAPLPAEGEPVSVNGTEPL